MIWLVRSAMCDLLPPHGDLPGLADAGIDAFLVKLRAETTALVWAGLVLGALAITVTPILTVYVPLPSMLLPRRLRDRHVDGVATTRIYVLRQAFFLVKMYACMCWGQDEAVRRRFHLAPYPVDPGTFRTS